MDATTQQLIERLGMTPLPVEATFFVSTYRSEANTETGGPVGTAMIGLYSDDPPSRSLFHRLEFDEVWHFYAGDPLRLVLLYPDGSSTDVVMGSDMLAGQVVQYVATHPDREADIRKLGIPDDHDGSMPSGFAT